MVIHAAASWVGGRRRWILAGLGATIAVVAIAGFATVLSDSGPNIRPLSADALRAVHRTESELRTGCYDEAQAEALLRTNLAGTGEPAAYSVRSDGPVAYPAGEEDAVREHLSRGCTTYSGTGLDPDGQRVFYIAGPDALDAWEAVTRS